MLLNINKLHVNFSPDYLSFCSWVVFIKTLLLIINKFLRLEKKVNAWEWEYDVEKIKWFLE
jgi:hypothetical protein